MQTCVELLPARELLTAREAIKWISDVYLVDRNRRSGPRDQALQLNRHPFYNCFSVSLNVINQIAISSITAFQSPLMLSFRLRLTQPTTFAKLNSKFFEFKTSNLRFIHFYTVSLAKNGGCRGMSWRI